MNRQTASTIKDHLSILRDFFLPFPDDRIYLIFINNLFQRMLDGNFLSLLNEI